MRTTKLDERFFDSTRGQIVSLLRGNIRTVNELAEELGLTDNAVRSHLLSLERDGLVRQCGVQRGTRKPHFAYELTPEAENLFPKAYDALLNQLITILKDRLPPAALEESCARSAGLWPPDILQTKALPTWRAGCRMR
jgi:predicted ArsR family transcriptional regulator